MRPVRIAVLCSGSASSFRWLHEHDPNFGKTYEIVGVFANSADSTGIEYAKEHGIPTAIIDFKEWREKNGFKFGDPAGRSQYFLEIFHIVRGIWNAEAIILSGFMLLVSDPLFSGYEGKAVNVHPALLSLLDEGRKRKYTGLNTVARAMRAGDPTGSTVHLITREADLGPIVAESDPLPYRSGDDPDAHQEEMKTVCDGPAFQTALERLIASGWPGVPWKPQ